MEGQKLPTAFLDASALYPSIVRNILMRCAMLDLFQAFWSENVQREWTRSVLRDRPHLDRQRLERTRRLMDEHIGGANVSGCEHLIATVTLPDADDRHVLAAAIHCGAGIIVTANLRDFPEPALSLHKIEAKHPDAFILGMFKDNPGQVIAALRQLREALRNPPMGTSELLAAMSKQGLTASADALSVFSGAL